MYKISDLTTMLDLSERTVRRHLQNGILYGSKVKGRWNFSDDDISNYLNSNELKEITKLKIIKNYSDFSKGHFSIDTASMASVNLNDISESDLRGLTMKLCTNEEVFDFKCIKVSGHHHLTFYGSFHGVRRFLELVEDQL